ncbi:MAG TPA: hypothetical protein VFM88_16730 [Vicinamibacteria bacterium]|nr:hypothetical protein [Vicinamibacteria bacterium]
MKERDLDALLQSAAAADAGTGASERVEAALVLAYREAQRPPRSGTGSRGFGLRAARDWFWAGLAAAAAVVAFVAVLRPGGPTATTPTAGADAELAFTPLVYGDPWSDVEAVQVVHVELPRTALAAFGYAPAGLESEGAAVQADVLVGNDGIARGIRFVR